MDTRSRLQTTSGTESFEPRIEVPSRASFGFGSLRNRKKLLGLGTIACLALAALYVGVRPATYTASSQLLIYIRQALTGLDQAILPGRADLPMVHNQIELLRSGNVLAKVVEELQLDRDPEFIASLASPAEPPKSQAEQGSPEADANGAAYRAALTALGKNLSVRQDGTSHLVTVSFKALEPAKAARIANAVVRTYLQERTRAFDAAASRAPTLREIYQNLGPSARVLSEAEPPVKKDGPPAALILAAAALVGFGLAAAIAILLDMFDDRIRSGQQMEFVLGLECLGVVPRFDGVASWPEDAAARRLAASRHPVLQRTAAMIEDVSPPGFQTVGVTSTLPGEGATTVAIGLAQAAAAAGKRVLLVDTVADNPSLSRWVAGLSQTPPLPGEHRLPADALDGLVPAQLRLHVLPLAERLAGDSLIPRGLLEGVLRAAQGSYDLVILDMPSLAAGPQVRAAAPLLDGFLLAVKWGATRSELVRQAFQSAGQARDRFMGTVLNMADEREMERRGYELPAGSKVVTTA